MPTFPIPNACLGRIARILLLIVGPPSLSHAQTAKPIEYAETHALQSKILGETRSLQIALPDTYSRTTVEYPVLFLLDGSSQMLYVTGTVKYLAAARNRIPEMIVVSIPNTNRNRDLTPGPGAVTFERFLGEELIPWVERTFRAAPERILFGHSLGGSLVVHTLLNRPELFQAYIAVSAPVWRYDGLATQVRPGLQRAASAGAELYLSVGEFENTQLMRGVTTLAALIDSVHPRLATTFTVLADGDHSSTANPSLYTALEVRYKKWRFPFFETMAELDSVGGLAALQAHYRNESTAFHHTIAVPPSWLEQVGRIYVQNARHDDAIHLADKYRQAYPRFAEQVVNATGYDLLRREQYERAVTAFRMNVTYFPDAPNTHDSLGEALCLLKKAELANESYANAFRIAQLRSSTAVSAGTVVPSKKTCAA